MNTRYASVVLDVDSTLCGIEGIDLLARRRGDELGRRIEALTDRAMRGELPLDRVYGERLALIQPTTEDIEALHRAYVDALAPGATEAIRSMRAAGVRLALVSGGIRQAIQPLAAALGFGEDELHAVALSFDEHGRYHGYDTSSPLATQRGKKQVVEALLGAGFSRPLLAVGDGSTDVFMRESADAFAAYVGFARRENVVARADIVLASFAQLAQLVLGEPSRRNVS